MSDHNLTTNRWVPISCHDLTTLKKEQGGFYFGKYRIEHVYMVGWIERPAQVNGQPAFILNDRTGKEIKIMFASAPDNSLQVVGSFVKLYGAVKLHESRTKFGVVVHRWHIQQQIPFDEEVGLYYETARVRENLENGGFDNLRDDTLDGIGTSEAYIQSIEMSSRDIEPTQPTFNTSRAPPLSNLLSLSRGGSILVYHPAFEHIATIKPSELYVSPIARGASGN